MNTTGATVLAYGPSSSDVYDADEAFLTNSPMLQPLHPKLQPSPSPPPTIIPPKVRSSGGDAILVSLLDGGRRPEIAAEAGERPFASDGDDDDDDDEEDEEPVDRGGLDDHSSVTSDDTVYSRDRETRRTNMSQKPRLAGQTPGPLDLKSLAAGALAAFSAGRSPDISHPPSDRARETSERNPSLDGTPLFPTRSNETPNDVRPILTAPISPPAPPSQDPYSPRQGFHGQVLMHPKELKSPTGTLTQGHGELPPIQMISPKSDVNGQAPLPSLRAHLGDQLTDPANPVEKEMAMRRGSTFPHSPPANIPRLGAMGSHASPPISPNDFRRDMPSPAHSISAISPSFYYSSSSAGQPRSGADYSSSTTETPNTEQSGSTPANPSDKMSIDSMTNPAGAYVCTFTGCSAAPFQTQYLLNSHANVHSSARPHYCSVKGCPRSEGGKGFKRKNEMIRHGLVHESPGYVCPFCPDREHKYPRPDNLQRHVRVHHVDKDKDDSMLRDVLSQRPDGPSRGRRRRGGP